MKSKRSKRILFSIISTFVVYYQIQYRDFINLDDTKYITGNPIRIKIDMRLWNFCNGNQVSDREYGIVFYKNERMNS